MIRISHGVGAVFGLLAGMAGFGTAILAHPHVWVTGTTTVLFEDGSISGFRHMWTFDEMYTAMAVLGLDTNGDGIYSREELAELAEVNITSLKEFKYFTFASQGDQSVQLAAPRDYWLEYKNDILTLHFTLPLVMSQRVEARNLSFSVYDETFYIGFSLAKDDPIQLGPGAPSGCVVSVGVPQEDMAQLQQLNDAFSGALTAGEENIGLGADYAQTVTLNCNGS